jgi:N utilization substance protein A
VSKSAAGRRIEFGNAGIAVAVAGMLPFLPSISRGDHRKAGAQFHRTALSSEHWRATCSLERMKKLDEAGDRTYDTVSKDEKGLGADSAGQSGDTQGLSDVAEAGPESVEELVEEGQPFEAEAIDGVEEASGEDVAEVHTKQVPEDDVPFEYRENE